MEWVAMRLLAEGHRMKDVAGKLGISIRTVETYRARLMLKLGIDTLPGLVKFAIRAGIITPGPWRSRRCRFRDEPVQLPSTFFMPGQCYPASGIRDVSKGAACPSITGEGSFQCSTRGEKS
jgi:hypothetical protein